MVERVLQCLLCIVATTWLLQRGALACKPLDKAGRDSDVEPKFGAFVTLRSPSPAGRWVTSLYSNFWGW